MMEDEQYICDVCYNIHNIPTITAIRNNLYITTEYLEGHIKYNYEYCKRCSLIKEMDKEYKKNDENNEIVIPSNENNITTGINCNLCKRNYRLRFHNWFLFGDNLYCMDCMKNEIKNNVIILLNEYLFKNISNIVSSYIVYCISDTIPFYPNICRCGYHYY